MIRWYKKWSRNLTHRHLITRASKGFARQEEAQADQEPPQPHLQKKLFQNSSPNQPTLWPHVVERPRTTEPEASPDRSLWPINLSLSLFHCLIMFGLLSLFLFSSVICSLFCFLILCKSPEEDCCKYNRKFAFLFPFLFTTGETNPIDLIYV